MCVNKGADKKTQPTPLPPPPDPAALGSGAAGGAANAIKARNKRNALALEAAGE